MSRRLLNFTLLMTFLASLAVNWTARPQASRTNLEFLPEMVRTPRYNAYSENENFPDGKTLQDPVPGTISRGFPPLDFLATPEEATRAGETLKNPIVNGDVRDMARGGAVFSSYCQPCHGPGGLGDGLVVQRGFPAPPSLLAENARKIRDGQIFHIVTFGQKNMPGHASLIGREDRWKVIAYIRSLQAQSLPQPAGVAP